MSKSTSRESYYDDDFDAPLFSSDDPCCVIESLLVDDPLRDDEAVSLASSRTE